MSYSYGKSIVTDGLVFYVDAGNEDSYPGTGTTWSDLVGGNDGSFNNMDDVNNPSNSYDSGNGGSIVFDGVDDYVEVNSSSINSSITTEITVECFCLISANTQYQVIGGGQDNTLYRYTASFSYNQSGAEDIGFDLEALGGQVRLYGSSSVNTSTWLHLCGTYDGTSAKLYINSALSDTDSTTSGNVVDFDNVTLGKDINTSTGRYLNGKIALFKIYNRALSATEVTQNYNALKNRFI